jgi:hypothetical protein
VGKNFAVLDIFFMGYLYRPHLHNFFSNIRIDMCEISILIFEKKLWRGGLYKYPIQNISRTAKFLPTFGQVKGIARLFI